MLGGLAYLTDLDLPFSEDWKDTDHLHGFKISKSLK